MTTENWVRSTDQQPQHGPTCSSDHSAPVHSKFNQRHYNALEKRCPQRGQEGHHGRACGNIGARAVGKTESKRNRDFPRRE